MKLISILFLVASITMFSCSRNSGDERAMQVCNCYDQIHNESVMSDNEDELQQKVNACNELFIKTLSSLDSNENEAFMKAFRNCQEN